MTFLTKSTVDAIMRNEPKSIHTIQLNGISFILKCDVEQIRKAIVSLRGEFDKQRSRYGYQKLRGNPDIQLTKEEYKENMDNFAEEFEKRLELDYVTNIIKEAVKKKNGTFSKRRIYNEYILNNVISDGGPSVNIYKVKYETTDDLVINLILHYTSEYVDFEAWS